MTCIGAPFGGWRVGKLRVRLSVDADGQPDTWIVSETVRSLNGTRDRHTAWMRSLYPGCGPFMLVTTPDYGTARAIAGTARK